MQLNLDLLMKRFAPNGACRAGAQPARRSLWRRLGRRAASLEKRPADKRQPYIRLHASGLVVSPAPCPTNKKLPRRVAREPKEAVGTMQTVRFAGAAQKSSVVVNRNWRGS